MRKRSKSEMDYKKDFDIKNSTTFKIGGKISEVFFPENIEEFCELLKKNPNIKVFGNLSNTLFSTNGYNWKIILTSKMDKISIEGNTITAQCGVKGPKLSQFACENGLSGLEFMIGFPGSIGGEVYMNASANSQAVSDTLVSAFCYSPKKGLLTLSKDELGFDYRTSVCQKENLIVLSAKFELITKDKDLIKEQMDKNLTFRKSHQPSLALPNCGSVFKNPGGDSAGRLLESVGAKELNIGGVRVWRNHSNFIVNVNHGTSYDVLLLMCELQKRVKEMYNIKLEPEIVFAGGKNKEENKLWEILTK